MNIIKEFKYIKIKNFCYIAYKNCSLVLCNPNKDLINYIIDKKNNIDLYLINNINKDNKLLTPKLFTIKRLIGIIKEHETYYIFCEYEINHTRAIDYFTHYGINCYDKYIFYGLYPYEERRFNYASASNEVIYSKYN